MKKIAIALDCDDVLYDCNGYALQLLNKKKGTSFTPADISSWGLLGNALDERLAYFQQPEFYRKEPLLPGAKQFVRNLTRLAEVFIITSTPPACMGDRIARIVEDFPEIPVENIFMGSRKSLLHMDILLDDGLHNIRESNADYPVLFRQPWNESASGILSVNHYEEFLTLVQTILTSGTGFWTRSLHRCCPAYEVSVRKEPVYENQDSHCVSLLCFVGPTGAGKGAIINELAKRPGFSRVRTWTTRDVRTVKEANIYSHLNDVEFRNEDFFEQTVYGGFRYGTKLSDVKQAMGTGTAVMALDICGCMAMKRVFGEQCRLIFVKRDKEEMLADILERSISNEEKKKRILSLDVELKNAELCDYTVLYRGSAKKAADEILNWK
ncbi:MAG: hypothetical protein LIO94_03065 [Clostridiales bacterium]|nr:hypothetical protein [Clostridiales bacterium]